MGYRSQIRSVIYGDPDLICALVAAETLTGGIALKSFGESLERYRFERTFYDHEATMAQEPDAHGGRKSILTSRTVECLDLSGDSWKWYPDYPDVKAWEALLVAAAEMGLNTEFVRIGEETDDIEARQDVQDDGDYLLGVSSAICDDIPDREPVDYTVAA